MKMLCLCHFIHNKVLLLSQNFDSEFDQWEVLSLKRNMQLKLPVNHYHLNLIYKRTTYEKENGEHINLILENLSR